MSSKRLLCAALVASAVLAQTATALAQGAPENEPSSSPGAAPGSDPSGAPGGATTTVTGAASTDATPPALVPIAPATPPQPSVAQQPVAPATVAPSGQIITLPVTGYRINAPGDGFYWTAQRRERTTQIGPSDVLVRTAPGRPALVIVVREIPNAASCSVMLARLSTVPGMMRLDSLPWLPAGYDPTPAAQPSGGGWNTFLCVPTPRAMILVSLIYRGAPDSPELGTITPMLAAIRDAAVEANTPRTPPPGAYPVASAYGTAAPYGASPAPIVAPSSEYGLRGWFVGLGTQFSWASGRFAGETTASSAFTFLGAWFQTDSSTRFGGASGRITGNSHYALEAAANWAAAGSGRPPDVNRGTLVLSGSALYGIGIALSDNIGIGASTGVHAAAGPIVNSFDIPVSFWFMHLTGAREDAAFVLRVTPMAIPIASSVRSWVLNPLSIDARLGLFGLVYANTEFQYVPAQTSSSGSTTTQTDARMALFVRLGLRLR